MLSSLFNRLNVKTLKCNTNLMHSININPLHNIPMKSMDPLMMRCMSTDTTTTSISDNEKDKLEYAKEISDIENEYSFKKARRQSMIGTVISSKASKSITVKCLRKRWISKYGECECVCVCLCLCVYYVCVCD